MEDLVTIIVPVYNSEKYLEKCLESIINQTHENLEIILIDDGSQDNSAKICDQYEKKDKRIHVVHQENKGVSCARNVGVEKASGEYITFVDADDNIDKSYIEKLLKAIKEEAVECAVCGYNRIYNQGIEVVVKNKNLKLGKKEFLNSILSVQGGAGCICGKLWKKDAGKNTRFNEKVKIGEDSLFCIQALKNVNNVYILNEPLYNYIFNENSAVRKYDEEFAEKCLVSMKAAKEYIEKEYKEDKDIIKKFSNYIAYHILLIAVNHCFNNENKLNSINQMKKMKEICNIPEFKYGIKKSNYDGLSLTRKITLFTIKYRLYFLTMIIAKIRQRQFKKS